MEEKVSVIIPVYNAEMTISRCVESLVKNTYNTAEIILIDDFSRDGSLKICRELEKKYSCVRVFQNSKNCGVSHTRNVGLRYVSGKYLCFVDSDDWVESDYIEKLVNAMQISKCNLAMCGFVNHDEKFNSSTDYFEVTSKKIDVASLNDILMSLYQGRLLQQLWNKIFLVSVIRAYGIEFDESISMGEDFRFVLQYLSHLDRKCDVALIGGYGYHYIRDNESSLMSKFGRENIAEPTKNIRALTELLDIDENTRDGIFEEERKKIEMQYAYRIVHNSTYSIFEKWKKCNELGAKNGISIFFHEYLLMIKERIAAATRR